MRFWRGDKLRNEVVLAPDEDILDALKGNIVSFALNPDRNAVRITECCDEYYAVELSPDEFQTLLFRLLGLLVEMSRKDAP